MGTIKIFLKLCTIFENLLKIMDVRDETHIIHSCHAAGWEKYYAIFLGVKDTF